MKNQNWRGIRRRLRNPDEGKGANEKGRRPIKLRLNPKLPRPTELDRGTG